MKRNPYKFIWFVFVLVIVSAGCTTTSKVSQTNLVSLYQPEQQFADLDCWVYHTTDSTSTLFVEVLFSNLVYQKDPYSGQYTCSYRLSFKLTAGYDSGDILATSSLLAGDSLNYGKSNSVVHSFEVKSKYPGEYLLEITLFDLNRKFSSNHYLEIDKTNHYGRQNFIILNQNNGLIFKNYLPEDEPFRIVTDLPEQKYLTVNYYLRDFPVARPPYTEDNEPVFNYKPDSVFTVSVDNGQSEWLTLNKTGFYHFRKDTVSREGLTLFCFHEGFPEITTAEQLRYPLRYITTRKEYDTLMENLNIKAGVDDFWLKTARTPERAKILFQKYYSNVEDANRYFTSYLEGWKTDRGLIYIIFGEPDYVYRGKGNEEWIFGEPQNRSSLRYTFIKVNNPFTDNDYMLLRSPTLKDSWFVTVQSWRR